MFLAIATKDSLDYLLDCFAKNGVDHVDHALITLEGGSKAIGELFGMVGKAGKAWMVNPDKDLDTLGGYSKYALRKGYKEASCEMYDCNKTYDEPTVRFLSPLKDDVVKTKNQYEIEWFAEDSDGITYRAIYFSPDDGDNWELIDSCKADNSSYDWNVGDDVSDSCRIKLHVYDSKGNLRIKNSAIFETTNSSPVVHNMFLKKNDVRIENRNNNFRICLPFDEICDVSIRNLQGKQVANIKTNENSKWYTINKNIRPGMYVVNINMAGINMSRKMILTK